MRLGDIQRGTTMRSETSRFSRAVIGGRSRGRRGLAAHLCARGGSAHEGSHLARKRDVSVESVPDPIIEEPTDAIIEITSTNICGSDLHLYEVLGAFMNPGDILGHEPMGIVREVGRDITNLAVGDRVVIPFQISCGSCYMCDLQLYHAVRDHPGSRPRDGCRPVRLLRTVRRGSRRAGRTAAGAAGAVHPHQGAGGATGLPLCLFVGRAADRLAGRLLRRYPRRRLGDRARPRADRRHGRAYRRSPRLRGHRGRPDPGTTGPSRGPRYPDDRSGRCGTTSWPI